MRGLDADRVKMESAWPEGRWAAWQTAALAAGVAVMACVGASLAALPLDYAAYKPLAGGALVLGAGLVAYLALGPSRPMIACFLVYMAASHMYRSFAVFPFGGVEWHPRELLLFLLLAHAAGKVAWGRAHLRPDIMHYFFFLYVVFFIMIAGRGLLLYPETADVIAECRYPVFLGAYFAFVLCGHGMADLRFYTRIIVALAALIATLSLAYFGYTFFTGVINVQNWLGEFVPRIVGPWLLQSVRPNGHIFFEVSVVVMTSMLFCTEVSRLRRAAYALLIALFLSALAIMMMRTAYVSLFLSLAVLVTLHLPREARAWACIMGIGAGGALALFFGLHLHETLDQWIPGLEASLRGRFVEIEGALHMFRREPLLGAGMGSKFTGMGFVSQTSLVSVAQADYQTVHNVWMYYLYKGGMVGVLFVVLGLGGIALRAHTIIERLPSLKDQFFMKGLLAAYGGQLIASLAMPRLTYPIGGVFLSMIAAAFVMAARDLPAAEDQS